MIDLFIIPFGWIDALDILLVALLLYQLYRLVKGTAAVYVFVGILLLYILFLVVDFLEMQLFSRILGKFMDVGVIALLIVFQQELRKFLIYIGAADFLSKGKSKGWFDFKWNNNEEELDINAIVKACKYLSETNTGAIIVITIGSDLKFYTNTGEPVEARVSARLIESVFFKNSPLHDGAIIITNNTIKAARCVLPVTENPEFPTHLGMRHRAAVGISEITDAVAISVSEQTGEISFAKKGELKHGLSIDKLREVLEEEVA